LAIARSYSIAGNDTNALALIKYAQDKTQESAPVLSGQSRSESAPRNIVVAREDITALEYLLSGELQRCQALVEVSKLQQLAKGTGAKVAPLPLVERLSEYPSDGVDLENIVAYPPRLDAIPVKPLFLDIAWNYIDYPAKRAQAASAPKAAPAQGAAPQEEAKPQKRGWFGFGR
jgi:signal recognition particle subunit SRP68